MIIKSTRAARGSISAITAIFVLFLLVAHAGATTREGRGETPQSPPSVSSGTPGRLDALGLDAGEQAWLREHPLLRLGVDPAWPPYESVDKQGRYSGIAADYVKLIGDRLGITMEVQTGLTWEQVISKLKAKELDVSPAITQTPERSQFLLFTRPHIKYSVAIVTRSDHTNVEGLTAFAGKKVVLVKG